MPRINLSHLLPLLLCTCLQPCNAFAQMKAWWFFGYEKTTKEGIRADVKALKDAGFGGVVYYDQNHAKANNGAEDGFSPLWWDNMMYAITEAHKAGLTVEMNISNGYVAGGRWIDAGHAMQRVAAAKVTVAGGGVVDMALPTIAGRDNYVSDIALVAFPTPKGKAARHFTATYKPQGKGRSGAMQTPFDEVAEHGEFSGAKFRKLPDIGVLQASNDSMEWKDVVTIAPMYSSQGTYPVRTNSFNAVEANYWRVCYYGDQHLREWNIGGEAMIDRWEEKSALHCDFAERELTPDYSADEVVDADDIVDLSSHVKNGRLVWNAPEGCWTILRLAAVLTGAKSKHGRENLLGYECDKLSAEAAELHWNSYMQVILDTLRLHGIDYVEGVTMDSHEGGSQNWTPRMLEEFLVRRGYRLQPYLPALAGYVVTSRDKTLGVLHDLRQTINDCMRDNYYGTLQRKARENGLVFTAQAIGNALCIPGDAISIKKVVDKPQGEFWAYQQDGAYDVKDCSSAAHLYAKPIASAEAMTDATYTNTPYELKRVADIAFALGAQEMVVCAIPHVPYLNPDTAYIAGREYAINRTNPKWNEMKAMWRAINNTFPFVRMGKADPDILVYLGDDLPVKVLSHRLPAGIEQMDWDACSGDALQTRLQPCGNGCLTTPDGVVYKALVIGKEAYISERSQQVLDAFRKAGVRVVDDISTLHPAVEISVGGTKDHGRLIVHTQRRLPDGNLYFLANVDSVAHDAVVSIGKPCGQSRWKVFRTAKGKWEKVSPSLSNQLEIGFRAGESIVLRRYQ